MAGYHIHGGYRVSARTLTRADAAAHEIGDALKELRKVRDALRSAGLHTAATDLDTAINAVDEVGNGLDWAARAAFQRARQGEV